MDQGARTQVSALFSAIQGSALAALLEGLVPEGQGLGHRLVRDLGLSRQVRNRPRHTQRAVYCTRRERPSLGGISQQSLGFGGELDGIAKLAASELGVGRGTSGKLTGCDHSPAHAVGRLLAERRLPPQPFYVLRLHRHLGDQINPLQQGSRHTVAITGNDRGRTATRPPRMREKATRTSVQISIEM